MKHGTILEGAIEWDTLVKIGGTPSLATRIIATAGRDSVALHKDLLDCYTEGVEAWQEWCAQYPTSAFTHEPARFFPGSFGDKGCLVIEQYLLAKGLICETPCRKILFNNKTTFISKRSRKKSCRFMSKGRSWILSTPFLPSFYSFCITIKKIFM